MMSKHIVKDYSLSWTTAHHALQLAAEKAVEIGVKVNISVVDRGGNQLAFLRMNGAPLHSISIAEDKAYTAVSFGFNTREWLNVIGDVPQLREGLVQRERLVIFGGGLPIEVDGHLVGAIGVSGASEDEDEACALSGLEALK